MSNKKVLIVEDEMLIASQIKKIIEGDRYAVVGIAVSYIAAMDWIEKEPIDVILLDIRLKGSKTGIDLGHQLSKQGIPFIFLTSHSDQKTLTSLKETKPEGYITKPLNPPLLLTTLDLFFQRTVDNTNRFILKTGKKQITINLHELQYIESSHIYAILHNDEGELMIRATLKQLLQDFPSDTLLPVNRSVLINLNRIVERSKTSVKLDTGATFTITKRFQS